MTRKTLIGRLLPVLILAGAFVVAAILVATRPVPEQHAVEDKGTLVATIAAATATHALRVAAQGVVIPAREIMLQPQVGGRVIYVSPNLVPGGFVDTDEVLFRIDPTDYELAVATQKTSLAEAEAAFSLEQGRQQVARKEWTLFEDAAAGQQDPSLVLREPQLRSAEAKVAAARAQLRQAQLNLRRTSVAAPFSAIVRSESIDIGQTVNSQSQAARLVGTGSFWVRASVPMDQLAYIDFQGGAGKGSPARISYDLGRDFIRRDATVVRLLGDLDQAGQMARVLIEVADPLGRDSGQAPLLLDSYVDISIQGNAMLEAVEIQRAWLHNGNYVYVMQGAQLSIREVTVGWSRPETVLVVSGLVDGDAIVTTPIKAAVPGMKLRTASQEALADTEGQSS